jgi:DNA-binding transcriptional regulator YbjK
MAVEETIDTRQRILHATLQLIAERGIGAVSNRLVAKTAGVSLGSLTYHFKSQTQLLRESLLLHVTEEVERIAQIANELRALEPASGAEVAAEVEREFERSLVNYGPRAELELYLHAARDPELQEVSRLSFAAYENFVEAALGALDVPEPSRHAKTVVALIAGVAIRGLGTGGHDLAGIADSLLTIMKGAATRTPIESSPT